MLDRAARSDFVLRGRGLCQDEVGGGRFRIVGECKAVPSDPLRRGKQGGVNVFRVIAVGFKGSRLALDRSGYGIVLGFEDSRLELESSGRGIVVGFKDSRLVLDSSGCGIVVGFKDSTLEIESSGCGW